MANIDAAFGLRPYRMLGSGANTNGDVVFNIQTAATAGTSSVIYQGTPVIPLANGMITAPSGPGLGTELRPDVRKRKDAKIRISKL